MVRKGKVQKKPKQVIIFGPWVGEFSYETNWWVPEARKTRNDKFPKAHAVAVSYIGRRGLYKDFIDEYIEYPRFLQSTIKYPSMTCSIENGKHVIPGNILEFLKLVINSYQRGGFEVNYVLPGPLEIPVDKTSGFVPIPDKVFMDFPYGEYKHLKPDKDINKIVKNKLEKFVTKRKWVYVMVSVRYRNGKLEDKSWPIEKYEDFIIQLITKLKVNVVLAGPKGRGSYPGALSLEGNKKLQKYKKYILDLVADEEIVEYQLALLKNTKCSFWNGTGACNLAFFTNTPMFTQQLKWYGDRLQYGWQRKLTNGHKRVRIFNKYTKDELADSPIEELFEEFKDFYLSLPKK